MHLTSRVALKILVDQNLGGDGRWRKKPLSWVKYANMRHCVGEEPFSYTE